MVGCGAGGRAALAQANDAQRVTLEDDLADLRPSRTSVKAVTVLSGLLVLAIFRPVALVAQFVHAHIPAAGRSASTGKSLGGHTGDLPSKISPDQWGRSIMFPMSTEIAELCDLVAPAHDSLLATQKQITECSQWLRNHGIRRGHFPESIPGIDSTDMKGVQRLAELVWELEQAFSKGSARKALVGWGPAAAVVVRLLRKGKTLGGVSGRDGRFDMRIDDSRRTVTRNGYTAKFEKRVKLWALFNCLESRPQGTSKIALITSVWGGVRPDDNTISKAVVALCKLLKPLGIAAQSRQRVYQLVEV